VGSNKPLSLSASGATDSQADSVDLLSPPVIPGMLVLEEDEEAVLDTNEP